MKPRFHRSASLCSIVAVTVAVGALAVGASAAPLFTAVDLGTFGGISEALAINDVGSVVGQSATTSGENHAFWRKGPDGPMIDLGTFGGS